ncbi:MAG: Hpt domain-containing protein [Gloeomargarita sp. SKYBB_i_bin120]|nr:Hpt domain-containing protein [Gloeomargarita sp. SKYG98]MCS7292879.1 Hpt domain-containing protein [Gloeomargarita sp. SKYB120]MDW8178442.1 Hpt domain-containing protein [Gloeomargarita sp. SKYBB_i_bin120]
MLPEQQRKILLYFIEEAKEHLQTLEQGLMNLQANARNSEMVNEMFRAAHSIKGGAAMLGFDSIRRTAHRLEDCLKIVKEHPSTQVDQETENLFLQGLETLETLIQRLEQGDFTEEMGQAALQQAEPLFGLLQQRLTGMPVETKPAVPANFSAQVLGILRQILETVKQGDGAECAQRVADLCGQLGNLAPDISTWQTLTQTAQRAATNPRVPLTKIAGVLLKELKQASELIQQGKSQQVAPSEVLCRLAGGETVAPAAPKQITIPLEPQEAAKLLVAHFEPAQLTLLAKLLVQALKRPN